METARNAGQVSAGPLLPRAITYAGAAAAAGCALVLSAPARPHAIAAREARPPLNTVIIFDDLQDMRRYGVILWHIWHALP